MKQLEFTVDINADREKVWDALWRDEHYRAWTAIFHEGSHYKSDMQIGSDIFFLGPNGDGMYAVIEELIPFEKMYFLHRGEVKNGEKQPPIYGDDSIERYELVEKDGVTSLSIKLFAPEEYLGYFANTFPPALEKVKEIAEN